MFAEKSGIDGVNQIRDCSASLWREEVLLSLCRSAVQCVSLQRGTAMLSLQSDSIALTVEAL